MQLGRVDQVAMHAHAQRLVHRCSAAASPAAALSAAALAAALATSDSSDA